MTEIKPSESKGSLVTAVRGTNCFRMGFFGKISYRKAKVSIDD